MPKKIAAGNWKMNGLNADLAQIKAIAQAAQMLACETIICPPATLLQSALQTGLNIGAQDCHSDANGAFTGDISAAMIADLGAKYVINGHSERRMGHGESSAMLKAKAQAAQAQGLIPIVCVGETLDEREKGAALSVIKVQLTASLPDSPQCIIAYEPIWAIGTGLVPQMDDIAQMHQMIRQVVIDRYGADGAEISLLYGGSVKGSNADDIFAQPDVNGALVGGASLLVDDFMPIMVALDRA